MRGNSVENEVGGFFCENEDGAGDVSRGGEGHGGSVRDPESLEAMDPQVRAKGARAGRAHGTASAGVIGCGCGMEDRLSELRVRCGDGGGAGGPEKGETPQGGLCRDVPDVLHGPDHGVDVFFLRQEIGIDQGRSGWVGRVEADPAAAFGSDEAGLDIDFTLGAEGLEMGDQLNVRSRL